MNAAAYLWPTDVKTAAIVSVLLEVWADDKWPGYFPRTTALKPGMHDLSASRWASFGIKEGVYRLLAALSRHKVKATFFVNAIVAERDPLLLKRIVEQGHVVASHGYSQDQFLMDMSREEQHATIKRCAELIAAATGQRPTGWVTPVYSWTEDTAELLALEGFSWHADALDASLPYWQKFQTAKIVALPWCDFVDNRVLRGNPRDYSEVYEDQLDYLKKHEPLGLLHVGMHCHFGGRSLMGASIDRVLHHLTSAGGLWLATHDEVADWFKRQNVAGFEPSMLFAPR